MPDDALARVRVELAQSARMACLRTLTESIAHEVNQPLTGVITNAGTCLRMLAADPANVEGARETARRIIRDGRRASDVIARLLSLFGKRRADGRARGPERSGA
jgi:C4-dicarboxylate-specific signal transduction histidine kinase